MLLTGPPTAPRLFTAGLPGLLQERDLASGVVLASTDSFGGAVWDMAAQAQDDGVYCVIMLNERIWCVALYFTFVYTHDTYSHIHNIYIYIRYYTHDICVAYVCT